MTRPQRFLRTRPPAVFAVLGLFLLIAASCSGDSSGTDEAGTDEASTGQLTIVSTVAPITSIVSNIVGDLIEVVGIVPEGTNSHTFDPPPSAAEVLSTADLVIINGLQLEEPTKELAKANVDDGVEVIELGDLAIDPEEYLYDFSFPESDGKPNPHLWTDPSLVVTYASIILDEVSALDPDNAEAYQQNFDAFSAEVDALSQAMTTAFATIDPDQRKLVTYHDAYAYFAQNYGFTVIGAVQPSDFGEPTARDVADLIDQIVAEGVPAIFGSEVFPSPVLEQIAAETGVTYVDDLRDDDLPGESGDEDHSWFGLMRFNYSTMTSALGGDPAAIDAYELPDLGVDRATYAQ